MKKILLLITLVVSAFAANAQTYPALQNADFESGSGAAMNNWITVGKAGRFQSLSLKSGSATVTIPAHAGSWSAVLQSDTQTIAGNKKIVPGIIAQKAPCSDSPSYIKFFTVYVPGSQTDVAVVTIRFTKYDAATKKSKGVDSINFNYGAIASPAASNYWAELYAPIKYTGTSLPDSMTIVFLSGGVQNSLLLIDDISFSKKTPASVNAIMLQPIIKLSDVSVYPNPANNTATLKYKTGELSHVAVELYDIAGRKVASLYEGSEGAGEHTLPINTAQFNNGLYIYRVMADGVVTTGKLIISK